MRKKKMFLAGVSAFLLSACGESVNLVGTWLQPVPGMPQCQQGFMLEADGKARSVNMATLSYKTWKEEDRKLILSGTSIGNRQTIEFTDTLAIEKNTADSLVLKKGQLRLAYVRSGDKGENTVTETQPLPARTPETVEGVLVIGHETRSLTVDGDTCRYWIVDKTDSLYRRYDRITGGIKNGKPVRARLQVADMGKPDGGFAEGYDKVLHVTGIESLSLQDDEKAQP